jgi:superfamily II DNA/RNA helicase
MGKFMKILLIKRLESSFFAFRNSIGRFINSYKLFIREFKKGNVYISKDFTNKIFEYLESDNDDAIQDLIDSGKADKFKSSDFKSEFIEALKSDLTILENIQELWAEVTRDPKLNELLEQLSENKYLKENKIILFTESKETAEYLTENVNKHFKNQALSFNGGSGEGVRETVIRNFDAKAKKPKNDYRILIATEVLSEGVNLHRANVVINYDIPWNPTRMMQRVGRINRVDTKFDTIYTFNFFPTTQSNNEIKLKEAAEAKINAFLTLLGGDAALLTEGEPIGSHELFNRLVSKKTITGEDETETSELKYLSLIKDIRDNNADLFEKIKRLPKKARSSKLLGLDTGRENPAPTQPALVTYFRKGKVQKFFKAGSDPSTGSGQGLQADELDFISAAQILESNVNDKKAKLPQTYFDLLDKNKDAFLYATTEDGVEIKTRKGQDSGAKILKLLKSIFKNTKQLTEDQEDYLKKVMTQLEEGGLPKQTTKMTHKALQDLGNQATNQLKVLAVLQTNIPERLLQSHYAEENPRSAGKREVILSMYLGS